MGYATILLSGNTDSYYTSGDIPGQSFSEEHSLEHSFVRFIGIHFHIYCPISTSMSLISSLGPTFLIVLLLVYMRQTWLIPICHSALNNGPHHCPSLPWHCDYSWPTILLNKIIDESTVSLITFVILPSPKICFIEKIHNKNDSVWCWCVFAKVTVHRSCTY